MVHNESLQSTIELQQSSAPPPAPLTVVPPMEKPAAMAMEPAVVKTEPAAPTKSVPTEPTPAKQEPAGPKIHKLKRLPHAMKRLLFSDGSEIIVPGVQPDLCHDADLISETGI